MAEVVERYLRHDGFDTQLINDGSRAVPAVDSYMPDLIVLDLMLPGLDGLEICRRVRARGDTPIIILTARSQEADKLVGLNLGGNDYVTKPFSPRDLAARVKVVLRRARSTQSSDSEWLRFDDLGIGERSRRVEDSRGPINLTAREFDLLSFMARHPGQDFTRDQLMDSVWDFDFAGDASTATVHMRRLRSKLEPDPSRPRHIKTVWGLVTSLSRNIQMPSSSATLRHPLISGAAVLIAGLAVAIAVARISMAISFSDLVLLGAYLLATLMLGWQS